MFSDHTPESMTFFAQSEALSHWAVTWKLERQRYRSARAICAAPLVMRPCVGTPYWSADGHVAGRSASAAIKSVTTAAWIWSTGVRVGRGLACSSGVSSSGTSSYTLVSQR